MKISEVLKPEQIQFELKAETKEAIIDELVDLLKDDERVNDLELIRESVKERENIMSTGVGLGFAIPHSKTKGANAILAAFGKTSKPVEFNSLDGSPVSLVFLLVGKENMVGPHIKLLSRISRMMNHEEFREALISAKSSEEIYNIFIEEENKYFNLS